MCPQVKKLQDQLQQLDKEFGVFMSYDPEYAMISQKLEMFIKGIQNEILMLQTTNTHAQELKRNILVLELQSFKNVPPMNKFSAVDLFRQKYLLML